MSAEELKQLADEIFGTDTIIDGTIEQGEFDIRPKVWYITMDALDKLRAKVEVVNISASEYKIELRVRI